MGAGAASAARAGLVIAIMSGACGAGMRSPAADGGAGRAAGGSGAIGAGGAAGSGAGGTAGVGGSLPADIGASLATTDTTIDATTGADLFALTRAIGLAEGYAQCVCLLAPQVVPENALVGCAKAESGFPDLFDPVKARCILEQSRAVPGFDAYLQCRTKLLRELGRRYAECALNHEFQPAFTGPCTAPDGADALLSGGRCDGAFYCADGTFKLTGRCDSSWDCADRADERGCYEFICGDRLIDPGLVCGVQYCPVAFDPPLCAPDDPLHFLCGDGSNVFVGYVCDGKEDCATGRDEDFCP